MACLNFQFSGPTPAPMKESYIWLPRPLNQQKPDSQEQGPKFRKQVAI